MATMDLIAEVVQGPMPIANLGLVEISSPMSHVFNLAIVIESRLSKYSEQSRTLEMNLFSAKQK